MLFLAPQKTPPDGEQKHAANEGSKNDTDALSREKSEEQIGVRALLVAALRARCFLGFSQLGCNIKKSTL
jgi:hypothetical protein